MKKLSADSKPKTMKKAKLRRTYLQRNSLRNMYGERYLQRERHAHSHTTECVSFTKETIAQWVMQREQEHSG